MTLNNSSNASAGEIPAGRESVSISYQWSSTNKAHKIRLNQQKFYPGYINGYHQPVVCLALVFDSVSEAEKKNLLQALSLYFPSNSDDEIINAFSNTLLLIQKQSGFPIFESVNIEIIKADNFVLWVPVLFAGCLQAVLELVLKIFNYHLSDAPRETIFHAQIENLVQILKLHSPQGSNSLRFLTAAFELNMPWTQVALNTFQYGYGQHSRWLDSSFTDATPQVSAKLIENKRAITFMLAKHGFPMPEQVVVTDEAAAVHHARQLGYPVVIKPIDSSGGKGVYANVVSEITLRKVFKLAKQISQTLLLEKHIPGKDYRCVVLNGKMIWAIERRPASVVGDGKTSIEALAKNQNIKVTEDTRDYLAEQTLSLDTIIPAGKHVQMSRIANIAAGGTPVAVFDQVHPDNQRLMEAAAQLLRLDLVGIDFITDDIATSYKNNGGKILEVNVKPHLGFITTAHIYQQILTTLVPQQGRIPITVIYGEPSELINELSQGYANIGVAQGNKAYINGEMLIETDSLFAAGHHLLLRNDIECLIYCVRDDSEIDSHGLPFDRYDHLYLVGVETKSQTLYKACLGEIRKR